MLKRIVRFAVWVVVIIPALWLLTHPIPAAWLIPFAREPNNPNPNMVRIWPILLSCLVPSLLAWRDWKWRRQVTFGWIALVFCSLQAYCFNTATHPDPNNPFVVWGFLPNRDGQLYLNNAVEIAEGIGIRFAFGPRQMWPGFLALLHTWCHGDLKLMLSLLTLMQAVITFTTWEMVYLILGRAGAFVWLSCITLFYRTYVVGTLGSEQLGLPLAMLAAVILLYSWRQRSFVPWLIGLLCLTFALCARPGCYFLVPVLLAGTLWRFRQVVPTTTGWRKFFGRLAWYEGTIAVAVLSLSIAANTLSYRHLVTPPRTPSNFWPVLYGIAKGGTWLDSLRIPGGEVFDFKQISAVSEDELWRSFLPRAKQAAIRETIANPGMFLYGAWRAWSQAIAKQTFFFQAAALWWGVLFLSISAGTLGLWALKGRSAIEDGGFYWLIWTGVFLSLPLAPPWDSGARVYAATNPLIWLTPAAFFSWCSKYLEGRWPNKKQGEPATNSTNENQWIRVNEDVRLNATMAVLIVISSILLPSILLELNRNRTMPRYSDLLPLEKGSAEIKEIPGTLIRPNRGIIVGPANSRTFLPRLSREDFERGAPGRRDFVIGEFMKELPDNSYIALLARPRYLICDRSIFQNKSVIQKIPLQETQWMAYKYIIALSENVALTEKQVMILCPSAASHEIFWKPAAPLIGQ
jgi:hypothetical protein